MKKILITLFVLLLAFSFVGCRMEPDNTPVTPPEDEGEEENPPVIEELTDEEKEAFASYMGAFGHVRVLGDIDHILKGEKVDDEPGVTAQSMVAGGASFDINKTTLTIPLTLTEYDFDGHRNPEDPEPEKYTRTATGTLTLVLTGAATAEGTSFVATGYRIENADVRLAVDDTTYIWLKLPEIDVTAESISGIFTTKGGISRASVTVLLEDGAPVGISDVNTPKFGVAAGDIEINGKACEL